MSEYRTLNIQAEGPGTDFSDAPEMADYFKEPEAMYIGAPGKKGYLSLSFELDRNGKSILRELERRHPLIVQQALYFDEAMPEMPCVYILSSGGPNVDGDRYRQDITMHRRSFAHIASGAATKIAEMRFNFSGLEQYFVLEDDSYLEYLPEPVIACRHARFISRTDITAAESATLFYSEIYTAGRKYYRNGESFEYDILSVCIEVKRPDGTPLLRDKFIIRPKRNDPRSPAVMGKFDIFADVLILTPKKHSERLYKAIASYIDAETKTAVGVAFLPCHCGLICRVLGVDTQRVKSIVRSLCSLVRQTVKNRKLPADFPWR